MPLKEEPMYKVILVDDEQVIRKGLKKLIEWDNYGFEVIAEAGDGGTAYDKIISLKPDLILLDIRMPGYDGVSLLKILRDQNINCKVIFLTGYAEFEYAKKAITLDVEAFLTKPIDELELHQHLQIIAKKLEDEKLIKQRLSQQLKLQEKQYYRKLLFNQSSSEDHKIIDQSSYCVVEVQYPSKSSSMNTYFELFQENYPEIICLLVAERWVLIYKDLSFSNIKKSVNEIIRDLKQYYKDDFFISVGRQVKGLKNLYLSFDDVKKIGEYWLLNDQVKVLYYNEQTIKADEVVHIDTDLLYSLLEVGNSTGIDQYFSNLENKIRNTLIDFNKVKGLCSNCILIIKERLQQQYQKDLTELPDNLSISTELLNHTKLSMLMLSMRHYLGLMENIFQDHSKASTLKRILDYIDKHYDKDLKLDRLGQIFGYNSSYLGTIFKQHVNMSFTAYLDKVRIEMAKSLLEKGQYKVYEISTMVGYNSVDYFHGKFKKHVKMTPKRYQLTCKDRQQEAL